MSLGRLIAAKLTPPADEPQPQPRPIMDEVTAAEHAAAVKWIEGGYRYCLHARGDKQRCQRLIGSRAWVLTPATIAEPDPRWHVRRTRLPTCPRCRTRTPADDLAEGAA